MRLFLTFGLILVSFPARMFADLRWLNDSEVTELSIKAFSGDKPSLERIVKEYRAYEKLLKEKKALTVEQNNLYGEILDTLQALSPQTLPQAPKEQIRVLKPVRASDADSSEISRLADKRSLEEALALFGYREGETLTYGGKIRWIFQTKAEESGKSLKIHILQVLRRERPEIDVLALEEEFSGNGEWLAMQTLVHTRFLPRGIEVQKNIVLHQSSPGVYGPIGSQDPFWLSKIPPKAGERTDSYQVENDSALVRTPLGEFTDCFTISSLAESYSFAPSTGLVKLELFDEQWLLKEKEVSPFALGGSSVSKSEESSLKTELKNYCGKNHLKMDTVLSVRRQMNNINGAAGGPDMPGTSYLTRTLAYSQDRKDPDQRIYQILEQKWVKNILGKKVSWELTQN